MPQIAAAPAMAPPRDCDRCPRLAALRTACRAEQPEWWNAPVPAFGDPHAWLAVVGLAPGKHGANRTGRAFTGDGAGDWLFGALATIGVAQGNYQGHAEDGLTLTSAIIFNAVKCLPPGNRPDPAEIHACRPFLAAELTALTGLKVVVALGQIAHQSAVKALGGKLPKARFAHGAEHRMPSGVVLIDSYHCSRYNQNTARLTREMFQAVFERAAALR
ncbi:uracil-DNA glycosylase [Sphingomonas sp.]|uniref:uracil-DNA glycosylase n=1 Tax=Sphingomonas sp. TaxID=28214 RepID=UPI001D35876A|nr:uracil-DNA glycosylase [Sphingomonas sp.]MBX9795471.1 uracil-DNA glycosylase [Sphingomonas sp.]